MRNLEEGYIRWMRSDGIAPNSIGFYLSRLRGFCSYCEARGIALESLGVPVVREYMAWLAERPNQHNGKPLAASTRAKHFDFLKQFSRFLIEKGIIRSSLVAGIRRPIPRYNVIHGFSSEQLAAILAAVDQVRMGEQYRDRLIVLLYLISSTGLRISEALQLKPISFDSSSRLIKVIGKFDREREVPYSHEVSGVIRSYIKKYDIQRDAHLFTSRYGRPLAPATVRDALRKIKQKLGMKFDIDRMRVSPHTFRHTFAKQWVIKDGNTIALSRILGHASTQMTDKYVRLWGVDVVKAYDTCNPTRDISAPIIE